nr:nucleoside triphosphate pyrophosphohydrolase [Clostridium algifaecis]
MPVIKVIGLGPGAVESITLGTMNILKNASRIYLRTAKHPTVKYLKDEKIQFETYDDMYENAQNFDDVYEKIAEDLVNKEQKFKNIVYAVPGHPLVAEKSVKLLIELCKNSSIDIDIVPAVSFVDAIFESLKIDMIQGIKIIDAFDIKTQILDKRTGIIITQVYNKFIASDVKLQLMEYYKPDIDIYFIRAAGVKELETIKKIKLYELDRQEDIDYLTSIYIPKNSNAVYDFRDLLDIVEKLRGENGCPWDREQSHESVKRNLIEESYEAVEAIEKNNDDELTEELGDVLFQVVFHSQMGKEEGFFDINDVTDAICKKMIERHPHVFGNIKVKNSKEVLLNWDEIKKKEQGLKSYTEELEHVAKTLPALIRADKVQKKASKIGFDLYNIECVLDKILEEYNEIKNVYKGNERAKIVEEIGDLIFTTVNFARFLDIDPEFALNYTIEKFIKRFAYIENEARSRNIDMKNMTLKEMDYIWEKSKNK